jgi:hypothetical protein
MLGTNEIGTYKAKLSKEKTHFLTSVKVQVFSFVCVHKIRDF